VWSSNKEERFERNFYLWYCLSDECDSLGKVGFSVFFFGCNTLEVFRNCCSVVIPQILNTRSQTSPWGGKSKRIRHILPDGSQTVLVLAGTQLNFFTVLCFGFVTKTVLIFYLGDVLAIAEQCLHSIKAFSASHPTPPVSRLEVRERLGGDTVETAGPIWPKGYSLP